MQSPLTERTKTRTPRRMPEAHKCVVFDFDQTLTVDHAFKHLAGWEGESLIPKPHATSEKGQVKKLLELSGKASSKKNDICYVFFGGEKRVKEVDAFLTELTRQGGELYVCTKGIVGAARTILDRVGLLKHFRGVYGNINSYCDPEKIGSYDKSAQSFSFPPEIQQHLNLGQYETQGKSKVKVCREVAGKRGVMLVEDDPKEVMLADKAGLATCLVEAREGIGRQENKEILEWVMKK